MSRLGRLAALEVVAVQRVPACVVRHQLRRSLISLTLSSSWRSVLMFDESVDMAEKWGFEKRFTNRDDVQSALRDERASSRRITILGPNELGFCYLWICRAAVKGS